MTLQDGYTLWNKEKNSEVPIIFLTAKSMKEDVEGYKAGADDYLNKPFDSECCWWIKAIIQESRSDQNRQVQFS
jgi:DNA-binding response OmpR family regulator